MYYYNLSPSLYPNPDSNSGCVRYLRECRLPKVVNDGVDNLASSRQSWFLESVTYRTSYIHLLPGNVDRTHFKTERTFGSQNTSEIEDCDRRYAPLSAYQTRCRMVKRLDLWFSQSRDPKQNRDSRAFGNHLYVTRRCNSVRRRFSVGLRKL